MKKSAAASQKSGTKIFIVDDHAIVREGLGRLLERRPGFTVCGESGDAADALERIPKLKPDVAVIDLGLPGMGGLELVKNLKIRMPKLAMLVVSMQEEEVYAERAIRAGARGYVMKAESAEKITGAVERVVSGKFYVSEKMSEKILDRLSAGEKGGHSPVDALSDRELEVFERIGQGLKTGRIAEELHLGVKTVESYKEQIKIKLGLSSAAELTEYAIQWSHRTEPKV